MAAWQDASPALAAAAASLSATNRIEGEEARNQLKLGSWALSCDRRWAVWALAVTVKRDRQPDREHWALAVPQWASSHGLRTDDWKWAVWAVLWYFRKFRQLNPVKFRLKSVTDGNGR
jgi:hypothetical protein